MLVCSALQLIHAPQSPLDPSFVCILKISRVGRSEDSRLVTCLEAAELALVPVKTCSKCDYYLANKALNAKASSLPQAQLSKFWQCASLHKVSELRNCVYTDTPYQP